MFFWSAFPFVRITLAFALGIIASVFLSGFYELAVICIVVSMVLLAASAFAKPTWFLMLNWLFGFLLVLLSFTLGYTRLFLEKSTGSMPQAGNGITSYRAQVISQPTKKGKYYKSTIELSLVRDSIWKPALYKINLYVKSTKRPFVYGDEILVIGTPVEIKGPQNPDEFNYKRYLSFLTIHQQHFTDSGRIKILSSGNGNSVIASSLLLREKFSSLLEKYVKEPNELAIAKALLLGNKSELDDEIKNTYAASGAMHVLAVSGLHVGIIYLVILTLLRLVPKQYCKQWLVAVIAIPLLWSYAFITGLSPSVLRAVTLFSIIAIGNSINRRSSMVNMLAVSALLLLMVNPYLLMQVGFQLSYIAVLGIIFIYPEIRKLWLPTDRVRIFFWEVTSISIAAQLATFPLSILYFHRFPPYFLMSNLVVIPAATLIVWVGIAFFLSALVSNMLAAGLGTVLASIIKFINLILAYIYQFPFSDLNNIYLNVSQTWVLYTLIVFLFLFAIYRTQVWANLASISMIVLTLFIGHRWIFNNQHKQLTIYHVPYHYSIDLIQGGKLVSFMDSALIKKQNKIHFHMEPNRLLYGVSTMENERLAIQHLPIGEAIVWNNISILIQTGKTKIDSLPFDVVISRKQPNHIRLKNSETKYYNLKDKGAFELEVGPIISFIE